MNTLRPPTAFAVGWWRRESDTGRALLVHDGFVGGSVWLDRASARCGVLLGYRARLGQDLSAWRVEFARLAAGG